MIFTKNETKICVPIAAHTFEEIKKEVNLANKYNADLIEWRFDYYTENKFSPENILKEIKSITDKSLIFTCRMYSEGGFIEIPDDIRKENIIKAIDSKLVEIIDVEMESKFAREIIEYAKKNNVLVIVSNHDFEKTPDKEDIVSRIHKMSDMKADIAKIAFMPKFSDDVLRLLLALSEGNKKFDIPIAAISMGKLGAVSRIAANVFGSCITFGSLNYSSAPGQLDADKLREIMNILT